MAASNAQKTDMGDGGAQAVPPRETEVEEENVGEEAAARALTPTGAKERSLLRIQEEAEETGSLCDYILATMDKLGWPAGGMINLTPWTGQEDNELITVAAQKKYNSWDVVAAKSNLKRTPYQCSVRLRTILLGNGDDEIAWTDRETEFLKVMILTVKEGNQVPWGRVGHSMLKNKLDCYIKHQKMNAVERHGVFLVEEDAVILSFVQEYGLHFEKLADVLVGWSPDQLFQRYEFLIGVQESHTWTAGEDAKLLCVVESWPLASDHSFLYYVETASEINAPSIPGKDIQFIQRRLVKLYHMKIANPDVPISDAGFDRDVWSQIQPEEELCMCFEKAVLSLKARLCIELKSFQNAYNTKAKNKPTVAALWGRFHNI